MRRRKQYSIFQKYFSVFSIKYKNGSKEIINKAEPKKNQSTNENRTEPTSIVSLSSSILGLLLGVSILFPLLGIIFGNIALKKINENNTKGKEMALWGKALGWVGLILGILFILIIISAG